LKKEVAKLKKVNDKVVPSTYEQFMATKLQRNFRRSLVSKGKDFDHGGRTNRISITSGDMLSIVGQNKIQHQKSARGSARGSAGGSTGEPASGTPSDALEVIPEPDTSVITEDTPPP
jgi:hypothetical protein